jgi:formamidopyrimidine-DNA glycosylase
MPELPEMETYRQLLTKLIVGARIDHVSIERDKSINIDRDTFIRYVQGAVITSVERRAKHLIFRLNNERLLLLHLMLGGWMFYGLEEQRPNRTVQIRLTFGVNHLYFIGLRLGYLHVLTPEEANAKLRELGPEPTEPTMTAERLQQLLQMRRGTLKSVLVDQKTIAGIGNCYSDEICFYAGLKPSRSVSSMDGEAFKQLYAGLRSCLKEACDYGGYMENPLYIGDDWTGKYNDRCKVYDLEGKPCLRCGHSIVREEVSSKKSFHCPGCQS